MVGKGRGEGREKREVKKETVKGGGDKTGERESGKPVIIKC